MFVPKILTERYGLDQLLHIPHRQWISTFPIGAPGHSFAYGGPAAKATWQNMLLTVILSLATLPYVWWAGTRVGAYSVVWRTLSVRRR